MPETEIQAFKRAIDILGTQKALADAVNRPQSCVSDILRHSRTVPAEWCPRIEQATGGRVTRHQLRPDLWPEDEGRATRRRPRREFGANP